jgi:hypothetical protein
MTLANMSAPTNKYKVSYDFNIKLEKLFRVNSAKLTRECVLFPNNVIPPK